MSEHLGEMTMGTVHARAVAFAGLLAELGVERVTLRSGPPLVAETDPGRLLESRSTDLPGLLGTLSHWHLEAGPLELRGTPDAVRWLTRDDDVASWVRASLSRAERSLPPNSKP